MAKTKIRNIGNRSKGGRPRKDGDRYPSGKRKPEAPNAKLVELRQAFGLEKLGQKFTPIEVAFHRGWIDEEVYWAAARYAALHRLAMAGAGAPQHANQNMREAPNTVDVRALSFAALTDQEVAAIWDSAMGMERTSETDQERQQKAAQALRTWNACMTPEQREEVGNTVLRDSWPQWIIQRVAGRFGTSWERKRELLIRGLEGRAAHVSTTDGVRLHFRDTIS